MKRGGYPKVSPLEQQAYSNLVIKLREQQEKQQLIAECNEAYNQLNQSKPNNQNYNDLKQQYVSLEQKLFESNPYLFKNNN